jgi:hypothetical protein
VQFVRFIGTFSFCYHITEQLSNVRTVLECKMRPIEEAFASLITYQHKSVTCERFQGAIYGAKLKPLLLLHLTTQLCDERTVLVCNMWRIAEYSASVIT